MSACTAAQLLSSFSAASPPLLASGAGSKKLPIVKLVDNFEASYSYVANDGPVFSFMTNLHAPRYRCGALGGLRAWGGPATSARPVLLTSLPHFPAFFSFLLRSSSRPLVQVHRGIGWGAWGTQAQGLREEESVSTSRPPFYSTPSRPLQGGPHRRLLSTSPTLAE